MDQQRGQRELYNGFGDGLSLAFEIALTPAIFAGLGFLADRHFGLFPVFTLSLLLFAVVGNFVRLWIRYDAQMKVHEAEGAWAKKPKSVTP